MNESERKAAKEQISKKGAGSASGSNLGLPSRAKTPMRKIVIKDEMRSAGREAAGGGNGRAAGHQVGEDLRSTMTRLQGP